MRNIICRIFGHTKPGLGVFMHWQCDRCYELLPVPEIERPDLTTGCVTGVEPQNQGIEWIQCLDCKRKSYNYWDIQKRYCGNCHKWHPGLLKEQNA